MGREYMCMYVTLLLLWHAVHIAVYSLSILVNNVQLKYNLPIEKIATVFAFQIVAFIVFFLSLVVKSIPADSQLNIFHIKVLRTLHFAPEVQFNFTLYYLLHTTVCTLSKFVYLYLLKYRNFSSAKFETFLTVSCTKYYTQLYYVVNCSKIYL